MKAQLKSIVALFSICAVIAILMAVTNSITAPFIQKNEDEAAQKALLEVMPNGDGFEKVDLSAYQMPTTVMEAYREQNGGYVFRLKTTGYASGMVLMCGVNADGSVSGAVCLASSETLGYESTFGETVKGTNKDTIEAVDTVSGATKTTAAYKQAVKDALAAFATLTAQS